jgi:hypothetical protein
MAMGWIRVYRKIQECILWDDNEPFDRRSAWVDLLLLANHEDKKVVFDGKPLTVKAGQRITSIRSLSERWHWSKDRVRRFLDLLESEKMITKESDNHRTLLTIEKYSVYQGQCDTDEYTDKDTHKYADGTQTGRRRDADGTQTGHAQDPNKNDKNDKNEKNDKNDKNEKKDIYGEYHHVRLTKTEFDRLCNDFGESTTLKAIKAVDEYCQEKGKTYKDYNLTIRRWGINAANENKPASVSNSVEEMMRQAGLM